MIGCHKGYSLPAAAPLLTLENMSLRFRGSPVDLIEDLSLSVSAGETLCLVGESGCGKSVTAMAMMGLLPRDATELGSGTLTFEGRRYDLSRGEGLDRLRGDRIAMIFQEPMTSLNPAFRIGDQIAEAVSCHRRVTDKEARQRALDLLRRVGLSLIHI